MAALPRGEVVPRREAIGNAQHCSVRVMSVPKREGAVKEGESITLCGEKSTVLFVIRPWAVCATEHAPKFPLEHVAVRLCTQSLLPLNRFRVEAAMRTRLPNLRPDFSLGGDGRSGKAEYSSATCQTAEA